MVKDGLELDPVYGEITVSQVEAFIENATAATS